MIVDCEVVSIRLTDMWHVPNMKYNLLSIASLEDKGRHCTIRNRNFDVFDERDDQLIMRGSRRNMGWLLELKYNPPTALRSSNAPETDEASWD